MPLELIEVELPRNKLDLIRLRDDYRRAGTAYEQDSERIDFQPLRTVPYLPNARMRDGAPDGRFTFSLRTGTDLYYRPRRETIACIPLCMSGVIKSNVHVVDGSGDPRPDPDKTYLCVSAA